MPRVEVPCFAKLNLDLRVLGKRPDGFHELRTIFQTVTLRDRLCIEFERSAHTAITVESKTEIADNLVVRAAHACLDRLSVTATIRFQLRKNIPMGAGLGGGSSDAAAVLLALPALAGKQLSRDDLFELAAALGSDVPFFLYGGTALGLGRGTELYSLPDLRDYPALIIASNIHVSTPEAYCALNRASIPNGLGLNSLGLNSLDLNSLDLSGLVPNSAALTSTDESLILREFQTMAWNLASSRLSKINLRNDFEDVVFATHPTLARLFEKLLLLGGSPVRMTGSGSALFGLFPSLPKAQSAAASMLASEADGLSGVQAIPVKFLTRRRYRFLWRQALKSVTPDHYFSTQEESIE